MKAKATRELEHEHRIIEQVVGGMAVLIEKLESGEEVDQSVFTDLFEFLQNFGDTYHHGKEERYLFKLLAKKVVPVSSCPLAVLVHDHERGRQLMSDLRLESELYRDIPNEGRRGLIDTLRKLVEFYPSHIWKEDYLLFPMAEKLLSKSEQKELSAQFARHEAAIGADVHHGFDQLAGRIFDLICGEVPSLHAA